MNFQYERIANFSTPYIIAEIGANHNGSVELAKKMIDQIVEAGASCAKFQSWTKDTIFSKKVYEENFFLSDDYRNRSDYTLKEIVEEFSFKKKEFLELSRYCNKLGIDFACTPFSIEEVDFLVDELNMPFIKVASMDLNNYPFLEYLASKNIPIILSTGLAELSEIDEAVRCIEKYHEEIIILHCVSNYPPKDGDVNLRNITMLQQNYSKYAVGFSDHTIGIEIPVASVALGSCIIEKHFTLDKEMFGWDHKVSADFHDLKELITASNRVAVAMGSYRRVLNKEDFRRIPAFRRSIVAAREILEGEIIEREDLDFKRPGTGIEPKEIEWIIGKKASRLISYDELIHKTDF